VSDSLKKISAMSLFVENLHQAKSFYQGVDLAQTRSSSFRSQFRLREAILAMGK